ncbi:MAG TPA: hypothetical protein VJO32_10895 [Ktedonobacteraceae bacterium]|nr:hypothetical protein [Ktedonobacteraceae bacterium]
MPKARRSKKSAKVSNAQSRAARASQSTGMASGAGQRNKVAATPPAVTNRRFVSPRVAGPRSLILPSMVALGCWGMVFSFAYFYNDPNHWLYAGLAAAMALLWTYSVYVRVRKLRATRQRSM